METKWKVHVDLNPNAKVANEDNTYDGYIVHIDGKEHFIQNKQFEYDANREDTVGELVDRVKGTQGIDKMYIQLM